MCHYPIPKLLRRTSAALKPTSTAGIFVGYSLTSHKYAVFVFSTGAVVERSRVYFNPDAFPDDLGGVVVSPTNRSSRNTTPEPMLAITTATADDTNSTDDDIEITEPTPVMTILEDATPPHESKVAVPDDDRGQDTDDGSDSETESDDNIQSRGDTGGIRRVPVFPKCPARNKNVDFELGDGFIIEEDRNVQNTDLDTKNIVTGKCTRRKPTGFEAKPASNTASFADAYRGHKRNMIRGAQMAAGVITLCMCVHCRYIRGEG
jgi:hypothetical protein